MLSSSYTLPDLAFKNLYFTFTLVSLNSSVFWIQVTSPMSIFSVTASVQKLSHYVLTPADLSHIKLSNLKILLFGFAGFHSILQWLFPLSQVQLVSFTFSRWVRTLLCRDIGACSSCTVSIALFFRNLSIPSSFLSQFVSVF